jgi:hypothetical protein
MSEPTTLLAELGYIIPTGITGVLTVCFILYMRWQEAKQDKDREEHVKKWESMLGVHKESINTLIAAHDRELDRQFKVSERNTAALEALAHRLSIIIKDKDI